MSCKAEDACPDGLTLLVDQHAGVLVKLDDAAVLALHLLLRLGDNRLLYRPRCNLACISSSRSVFREPALRSTKLLCGPSELAVLTKVESIKSARSGQHNSWLQLA